MLDSTILDARAATWAAPSASIRRKIRLLPAHVRALGLTIDGLALSLASVATIARWSTNGSGMEFGQAVLLSVVASGVTYLSLANKTWTVEDIRNPARDVASVVSAALLGAVALTAACWLLGCSVSAAGGNAVIWGVAAVASLEAGRLAQANLVNQWVAAGRLTRHVAVVGAPEEAEVVAAGLDRDPDGMCAFAGAYDDRAGHGASLANLVEAARHHAVDQIIVAVPPSEPQRVHAVLAALRSVVVEVHLLSDVTRLGLLPASVGRAGACHTLAIQPPPLTQWAIVQKAAFDRIMAAVMLLALLPVLAATALAIRIDSPGPVFFRQPRVGYNNRMFRMFKFRSMFVSMSDIHATRQTSRDDPRVTPVGRVIRKYSLDELPQLINVLLGDMSLVGPRPHATNTRAEGLSLEEAEASYTVRHRVRPGITGWAQVNGSRGELRTAAQVRARVAHDLYYIENWSLWLDLRIIMLTAMKEIRSKSAF